MKLSDTVDEETVAALRAAVERDAFPGISFVQAMEFLLSGGLFPADGLPITSFYRLEDWARGHATHRSG
jgi:hypothetical protein